MNKIIKRLLLSIPIVKQKTELINTLNYKIKSIEEKNYVLKQKNTNLIKKEILLKSIIFKINDNKNKLIINNLKKKKKIKICFFVIYDSAFSTKEIFEKMQKDTFFEPFILIIPDISRGKDNMFLQMEKSYKSLSLEYNNVYQSYSKEKNRFIDFSKKTDIVFTTNPYDFMTHKLYRIRNLNNKNIPILYSSYGYCVSNWFNKTIKNSDEYNLMWRIFTDTNINQKQLNTILPYKKAAVSLGFCKMDKISKIKKNNSKRKKIIIAPHHTIIKWKNGLNLSNFLKYYNFFLRLPKKYPDIDFIFRPHPLLFPNLINNKIWSKNKVQKYINDIKKNKNMVIDNSDDYFNLFINSDGLIHDCGSFLAEYLFSLNPVCYLVNKNTKKELNKFGKECLKLHYLAKSKKEIINFIEEKIIKGEDMSKKNRIDFVNKNLKINYPKSSLAIKNYIKNLCQ